MSSVDSCVNFLKAKSINVQREWCEACVEWLVEEHDGQPSSAQLTNLVYEQWLMADLREIATPSFPQGISGRKGAHTYQGKMCVQVDQTLDISRSAYSQLSKIKGTEVDDVDDADGDGELKQFFKGKNDTKTTENKWKKDVSSRMLMLQLHDGHQCVDAIEYRPIKQLDVEDPLPGGKVMLIGPYTARDGLLFLEDRNIKVLGGNVEDLVEKASQLKLLAGILDADISTNPQQTAPKPQLKTSGTTTASSSNKTNTNQTTAIASNNSNNNRNSNNNDNNANLIDDDFFINDIFDDIEVDGIDDLALSQMPVDDNPPPPPINATTPKPVPNSKKNNNNRLSSTIKSNVSRKVKNEDLNYDSPGLGGLGAEMFCENISIVGDTPVNEAKMTSDNKGNVKSENCKLASRSEFERDDCETSVVEMKEEEDTDDHQSRENPKQSLVNGKAGKETSLSEVIANEEPMKGLISLKASFTTLTSKLVFEPCYHLTAIITDGDAFFEVTLGDEALEGLVEFTAEELQEAVAGKVSRTEKKMMSAAIKKAEKALEEESWHLKMEFNEKENIYCVVSMLPAAK